MVGRSIRADHDAPRPGTPTRQAAPAVTDPDVPWVALLLAPTQAARADSAQPLTVHVGGPVVLDTQRVQLGAEDRERTVRWADARWVGQPDRGRMTTTTLGTTLRLPPGLYRVLVRVHVARDEVTALDAGAIVVT